MCPSGGRRDQLFYGRGCFRWSSDRVREKTVRKMQIDVYSHLAPQGYESELRSLAAEDGSLAIRSCRLLVRPPEDGVWQVTGRLREMEESEVGVSVLSLPRPGVFHEDARTPERLTSRKRRSDRHGRRVS